MKIRRGSLNDFEVIHQLSWQLGYTPSIEQVKTNITNMLTLKDHDFVVAVNEKDGVVGWMTLVIRHRIEDTPFLQVAALVTDDNVRGKGVGRLLMNHAAHYAQENNLPFVGLHSSKSRIGAHAFYEHIGYTKAKESYFFRKNL